MSSTHTLGPLELGELEKGTICHAGDGLGMVLYRVTPAGFSRDNEWPKAVSNRVQADLTLFCAASDLLAACKAASDLLGDLAAQLNPSGAPSETHLIPLGVRAQLEAALAKAEGGAE